jgi:uncharacterized protein YijF (DUF1287 family)
LSHCTRRDVLAGLIALASTAVRADPVDAGMRKVIAAAIAQTKHTVTYDGSYRRIAYPGGDVPHDIGVCTDVIIRAYRAIAIDLQQLVHEDMVAAFHAYPQLWGMRKPDPNIDHRRVPNLQTYFRRRGASLPVTRHPSKFEPGDLITWMLPGNLPHIGLVIDRRSAEGARSLIVHNIGRGPQIEDAMFHYLITGHYRFRPTFTL